MNRTFTCIVCPVGCEIEVEAEGQEIRKITGEGCPRGRAYVENEIRNPMRSLTSSVLVDGGTAEITSVRLTKPIPRNQMMDVMRELRKIRVEAPVALGQIIYENILGLGSDVMITKSVGKAGKA